MCSALKQLGRRRLSRIYRGCIFFVVLLNPVSVFGAAEETEVGVTAASNISAVGQPPVSPARDLETGLEVFFSENIISFNVMDSQTGNSAIGNLNIDLPGGMIRPKLKWHQKQLDE